MLLNQAEKTIKAKLSGAGSGRLLAANHGKVAPVARGGLGDYYWY